MPPALHSTFKLSHLGVKSDAAENGQLPPQQCAAQGSANRQSAPLTKNQTIDTFYSAGETRGELAFKCDPLAVLLFASMVHE